MMDESQRLADQIRHLAAGMSTAAARMLALIADFDRREAWRGWGCASTAAWLCWQCDMSVMTAREHVRVARALASLPVLGRALEAGELSYTKVRALTRIAIPEDQEAFLRLARSLTAAQLEVFVRARRRGIAVTDPAYARRNRSLRGYTDEEGMGVLVARLPVEEQALVWEALRRYQDDHGVYAETDDDLDAPPPAARGYADALVGLARAYLEDDAGGEAGRARPYLALIHVDGRDASVQTSDGSPIATATAERILCDAAIARVAHHPSGRVDLGRTTRIVSPALRRAVLARRAVCSFPGCSNRRYLHIHHRTHWTRGGHTSIGNLEPLCTFHHQLLHECGWTMWRDRSGLAFRSPDGRIVREEPGYVARSA